MDAAHITAPWVLARPREEYDEASGRKALPAAHHALELSRAQDSVRPPEAAGFCRHLLFGGDADRQSLPPLRSSTLDNRPAGTGLHPGAETMNSLAANSTRLIGPFHRWLSTFSRADPTPSCGDVDRLDLRFVPRSESTARGAPRAFRQEPAPGCRRSRATEVSGRIRGLPTTKNHSAQRETRGKISLV